MNYVGPLNIIVSAAILANSSDVFTILDPDSGGAATFSVALSPNGAANPTHFGARTYLEEATLDALVNMDVTQFKAYVDEVAEMRGREPIGSVTAFKNNAVIDHGEFWAFVEAQGLKPIQSEMAAQGNK